MKRFASVLMLAVYTVQLSAGCGLSTDSSQADEELALERYTRAVLGDTPLTVPSDTVLATERAPSGIVTGQMEAGLQVTPDGQASYGFSLWVPPGRAGMQPSLSVSYRSQSGNGLLGMGWGVSGLSYINRCRKTFAQDAVARGVQFTSEDGFCLDGKRLVPVGPTDGSSTEYRTEVDSFSKVIAHHALGGAPDLFEVYLKDGRILTYGGDAAAQKSRLEGQRTFMTVDNTTGTVTANFTSTPVRLSWALSSARDRVGNDMRFHYLLEGNTSLGYEQVPDRIEYTGRVGDSSGLLRRRSVRFVYAPESRPDTTVHYVSGLKLRASKRLARIEMYGPGLASTPTFRDDTLLRSYGFDYRNDSLTHRSLLSDAYECDGQGACRDLLQFTYESGRDCTGNPDNDCSDPTLPPPVDFEKLVAREDNGTGSFPSITDVKRFGKTPGAQEPVPGVQDFWTLQTGDINGDGVDDLLYRRNDDAEVLNDPHYGPYASLGESHWYYRLGTGGNGGFFKPAVRAQLPKSYSGSAEDDLRISDMDGDGTMEVLALQHPDPQLGIDGSFQLYRLNGSAFQPLGIQGPEITQFWWNSGSNVPYSGRIPVMHVADLNGDGLPDLFRSTRQPSLHGWGYRMNQGNNALSDYTQMPLNAGLDHAGYTVDIDGDASTEVLVRVGSPDTQDHYSAQYMAVSVGPGTQAQTRATALFAGPMGSSLAGSIYHYTRTWFLDINGDGLADAVSTRRDQMSEGGRIPGDLSIAINTGNGFAPPSFQDLPPKYELSPSRIFLNTSNLTNPRTLDPGVRVLDFDLDGRQDLLLTDSGATNGNGHVRTTQVVLLARGDHFEPLELDVPVGDTTGDPYAGKPFGYAQRFTQVMDANGDGFADIAQVKDGALEIYRRKARAPDVLVRVTGGKQARGVEVRYAPLRALGEPALHTPGTCTYPQMCVRRGPWVVAESRVDDGTLSNTFNRFLYTYEAARVDLQGRGWIGFGKRTVYDLQTGGKTTTTYDNQTRDGTLYLRASDPSTETSEILLDSGVKHVVSKSFQYTIATGARGQPFLYAHSQTDEQREGTSSTLELTGRTTQTRTLDAYGNATVTEQVNDVVTNGAATEQSFRLTASAQYDNTESSWLIGLVRSQQRTSTTFDGHSATRTTAHEYYPATNLLRQTTEEPGGGADFEFTTVYQLDGFGLVEQVDRSGSGLLRQERTEYDDIEHSFPTVQFNAMNHRTRHAYHLGLGVVAVSEDPNGQLATFRYDGFGRPRSETSSSGAAKTYQYGANSLGLAKNTVRDAGGQETTVTLDNRGREVRRDTRGFDGNIFTVDSIYDRLGRKVRVSRPHLASAQAQYVESTYDKLNRPLSLKEPDSSTPRTISYSKLRSTKSDERGNQLVTVFDALGQVVSSSQFKDAGQELKTRFEYGPFGTIRRIIDPLNNETVLEHDRLGRRTKIIDPDAGTSTTHYNAFGEMRLELDGNNKQTTYNAYDALGRQLSITTADGVSTFVWDTAPHGVGELASATSADGITTRHVYDSKGLLARSTWSIEDADYSIDRQYDTFGRLSTIQYPSVGGARFTLSYGYTDYGYLRQAKDAFSSKVYWTAEGRNAYGQLTAERMGNGVWSSRRYDARGRLRFIDTRNTGAVLQGLAYEWDEEGNLKSRHDVRNPTARTTEDFTYDALDRLTRWTVHQNCQRSILNYAYDDIGNLLSRTVVEGHGTSSTAVYTGTGSGGPHAVKQSSEGSYGYDLGGNQVSGPGRTVSYTAFNLPASISGQGTALSFKYDARNARTVKRNAAGATTYYVGGLYEKRVADGQNHHVFLVPGAEGLVAQVVWPELGGTVAGAHTLYLHTDHLGSTETVSDDSGAVVERLKFEPFGARRQPHALTHAVSMRSGEVRKGYTGHEPDDEFGLVNMGGRIYDPGVGRFLSPDPMVQAPTSSQSFNRYSYTFNNPLRWTDPTGFEAEGGDAPSGGDSGLGEFMDVIGGFLDNGAADWGPPAPEPLSADQNGIRNKFEQMAKNNLLWRPNSVHRHMQKEGLSVPTPAPFYYFEDERQSAQLAEIGQMVGQGIFKVAQFVALDLVLRGGLRLVGGAAVRSLELGEVSAAASASRLERAAANAAAVERGGAGSGLKALGSRINPKGYMDNCGSCSISLDQTLGGRAATAINSGPMTGYEVAKAYGKLGFSSYPNLAAIEQSLLRAGPGARGIVQAHRGLDAQGNRMMGHFFNAVNQDGKVVFLDAQIGAYANTAPSTNPYVSFDFLRTYP